MGRMIRKSLAFSALINRPFCLKGSRISFGCWNKKTCTLILIPFLLRVLRFCFIKEREAVGNRVPRMPMHVDQLVRT
ncbi:hypothetical protein EMPG_13884, partial [Blastomyces silverae]